MAEKDTCDCSGELFEPTTRAPFSTEDSTILVQSFAGETYWKESEETSRSPSPKQWRAELWKHVTVAAISTTSH